MTREDCNKICNCVNLTDEDVCFYTPNKIKRQGNAGSIMLICQHISNIENCQFRR